MKVGLWQITDDGPNKIPESHVDLERHIEDWIEADPSLLQPGLVIVSRQLTVEGGIIDLLALDPQGRWIIIEVKRGQLHRDTVAQILDYESSLASLPSEDFRSKIEAYLIEREKSILDLLEERSAQDAIELNNREILLMVVGTSKAPGLERMITHLSGKYQIPISVVSFSVFETNNGTRMLARELSEPELAPLPEKRSANTVEQICEQADRDGVGKDFRAILHSAEEIGLYPRPFKKSIMYTPPFQRNRMLFTVYAEKHNQRLQLYAGPSEFVEFYSVSEEEAVTALNLKTSGWQEMDSNQVQQFISGFKKILSIAEERSNNR